MKEPKLTPEDADRLAKLERDLGTMGEKDLKAAWDNAKGWMYDDPDPPASITKQLGQQLGAMIASKDGDTIEPDPAFDKWEYDVFYREQLRDVWQRAFDQFRPQPDSAPTGTPAELEASAKTETGHYDDGHAFGWQKPADPPLPANAPDFGWKKKDSEPKSETRVPMPLIGIGAAGLLLVAGLLFLNRPATVASNATQAAATSSLAPATNAPAASRPAAVIDVCALVTAAESSTILEQPTTPQTTTPGLQCFYKPQTPATWSFKEGTNTGKLRVDSLFITIATGTDAQSRYAAKQAIYGKDPTVDEVVSGIGDKAIFTAGTELSVLSGARFINVRFQGEYDWGNGNVRYETVHQKIISLLSAFAKTALPRMP